MIRSNAVGQFPVGTHPVADAGGRTYVILACPTVWIGTPATLFFADIFTTFNTSEDILAIKEVFLSRNESISSNAFITATKQASGGNTFASSATAKPFANNVVVIKGVNQLSTKVFTATANNLPLWQAGLNRLFSANGVLNSFKQAGLNRVYNANTTISIPLKAISQISGKVFNGTARFLPFKQYNQSVKSFIGSVTGLIQKTAGKVTNSPENILAAYSSLKTKTYSATGPVSAVLSPLKQINWFRVGNSTVQFKPFKQIIQSVLIENATASLNVIKQTIKTAFSSAITSGTFFLKTANLPRLSTISKTVSLSKQINIARGVTVTVNELLTKVINKFTMFFNIGTQFLPQKTFNQSVLNIVVLTSSLIQKTAQLFRSLAISSQAFYASVSAQTFNQSGLALVTLQSFYASMQSNGIVLVTNILAALSYQNQVASSKLSGISATIVSNVPKTIGKVIDPLVTIALSLLPKTIGKGEIFRITSRVSYLRNLTKSLLQIVNNNVLRSTTEIGITFTSNSVSGATSTLLKPTNPISKSLREAITATLNIPLKAISKSMLSNILVSNFQPLKILTKMVSTALVHMNGLLTKQASKSTVNKITGTMLVPGHAGIMIFSSLVTLQNSLSSKTVSLFRNATVVTTELISSIKIVGSHIVNTLSGVVATFNILPKALVRIPTVFNVTATSLISYINNLIAFVANITTRAFFQAGKGKVILFVTSIGEYCTLFFADIYTTFKNSGVTFLANKIGSTGPVYTFHTSSAVSTPLKQVGKVGQFNVAATISLLQRAITKFIPFTVFIGEQIITLWQVGIPLVWTLIGQNISVQAIKIAGSSANVYHFGVSTQTQIQKSKPVLSSSIVATAVSLPSKVINLLRSFVTTMGYYRSLISIGYPLWWNPGVTVQAIEMGGIFYFVTPVTNVTTSALMGIKAITKTVSINAIALFNRPLKAIATTVGFPKVLFQSVISKSVGKAPFSSSITAAFTNLLRQVSIVRQINTLIVISTIQKTLNKILNTTVTSGQAFISIGLHLQRTYLSRSFATGLIQKQVNKTTIGLITTNASIMHAFALVRNFIVIKLASATKQITKSPQLFNTLTNTMSQAVAAFRSVTATASVVITFPYLAYKGLTAIATVLATVPSFSRNLTRLLLNAMNTTAIAIKQPNKSFNAIVHSLTKATFFANFITNIINLVTFVSITVPFFSRNLTYIVNNIVDTFVGITKQISSFRSAVTNISVTVLIQRSQTVRIFNFVSITTVNLVRQTQKFLLAQGIALVQTGPTFIQKYIQIIANSLVSALKNVNKSVPMNIMTTVSRTNLPNLVKAFPIQTQLLLQQKIPHFGVFVFITTAQALKGPRSITKSFIKFVTRPFVSLLIDQGGIAQINVRAIVQTTVTIFGIYKAYVSKVFAKVVQTQRGVNARVNQTMKSIFARIIN